MKDPGGLPFQFPCRSTSLEFWGSERGWKPWPRPNTGAWHSKDSRVTELHGQRCHLPPHLPHSSPPAQSRRVFLILSVTESNISLRRSPYPDMCTKATKGVSFLPQFHLRPQPPGHQVSSMPWTVNCYFLFHVAISPMGPGLRLPQHLPSTDQAQEHRQTDELMYYTHPPHQPDEVRTNNCND